MSSESAGHESATESPRAVCRANAYHVLAQTFREPSDWESSLPGVLRERFARVDPGLGERAALAADALEQSDREGEEVAVAHARLFLGPFEIQAAPYASLYLDPERRLMGPISREVARAYAEAGLGPGPTPREAPDHVTCELEFMYFLAFQEATTEDPRWAERQRSFWQTHLGRWLPELARHMVEAEAHPFYDALARLVEWFAVWETDFLSGATTGMKVARNQLRSTKSSLPKRASAAHPASSVDPSQPSPGRGCRPWPGHWPR